MENDLCIIIQGPSENINQIKKTWHQNQKIIFSTWIGEENKYTNDDEVIFNEKPKNNGVGNLFYQQITTINGLKKAKNQGYKKAIKIRSDMICTNPNRFIELFTNEINFFYWHDYNGGYLVDYFMGGNIEKLIELWSINEQKEYTFPEEALTDNFKEKQLFKSDYKFIGKQINIENDIYWLKYNKKLSSYSEDCSFLDYMKF